MAASLVGISLVVLNFGVSYGWWGWGMTPSDMNAWVIANVYIAAGLAVNAIVSTRKK